MQNKFFAKKDAINITPFLDIMLVLFVVIIVVAFFNDKGLKQKNEILFSKMNELKKQLDFLRKENTLLHNKNKILLLSQEQNSFFQKKSKEMLSKCILNVNVMDNYVEIGNTKYSINQFISLTKNGFVKNANFYIKKTPSAENFYKKLKEKLKKLGFSFKN